MKGSNMILGFLAIVLGILVIAFPLISVFTASIIAGLGILFAGIWLLARSIDIVEKSFGKAIVLLLIGIIGIIAGIGIMGKLVAFGILASFAMYIAGIFLIMAGALSMFSDLDTKSKGIGGIGIVLGFLVIFLGFYAYNPFYLAILIGFALIIFGFSKLLETTKTEVEEEEKSEA